MVWTLPDRSDRSRTLGAVERAVAEEAVNRPGGVPAVAITEDVGLTGRQVNQRCERLVDRGIPVRYRSYNP